MVYVWVRFALAAWQMAKSHSDNVCVQRSHGEDERSGSDGSEDDDYVPYVPVKIRKQQKVSCCALSCLCHKF